MASKESDKLRSEVSELREKARLKEEAEKLIDWSKQLEKEMDGRAPKKRGREDH
jgi:hypothetical protein